MRVAFDLWYPKGNFALSRRVYLQRIWRNLPENANKNSSKTNMIHWKKTIIQSKLLEPTHCPFFFFQRYNMSRVGHSEGQFAPRKPQTTENDQRKRRFGCEQREKAKEKTIWDEKDHVILGLGPSFEPARKETARSFERKKTTGTADSAI